MCEVRCNRFEDRARECSKLEVRSNEWWSVKKTFMKEITRSCREDYRDYILGLIDQAAMAAEKGMPSWYRSLLVGYKAPNHTALHNRHRIRKVEYLVRWTSC